MRTKANVLVILITLIVIVIGIRQITLSSINSLPKFLIPESNLQSVNGSICFGINQKELWSFGDQADELQKYLILNTQISVDSQELRHDQITFFNSALLLFANDQNGKVIGSYGTAIRTCFQTDGLFKGSHEATIRIKNRSEQSYQYQWEFIVS